MKENSKKYLEITDLKDMLNKTKELYKNNIAYKLREAEGKYKEISHEEVRNTVDYLGTALINMGLKDKRIAVIGENSYNWLNVYLTVLQSDGVIVPIDKELTCKEIINVLKSSDSEVLFYAKKYEEYIEEIRKEATNIKYFIGFSRENDEENLLSYKNFIEKGKKQYENGNDKFAKIEHQETNSLKMLVYTSGTTGNPKGVMLTEHNLVSCAYYGLQVAHVYTKSLSVLPYHHTYEAVAGILVALYRHVTICINDSLKNVLKNLQLYKPDYIYLVPAFGEVFYKKIWSTAQKSGKETGLKLLIKLSNFLRKIGIDKRKILFKSVHEAFGGNLKEIIVGGAPLRAELGDFFESIGIELYNGYGITECSPLVSVNMKNLNDPRTVGVVLPCCEVKFENVTEDGDGEVCVKGDIVMMGYYKDQERTAKVLKDGWFNTEDYGRLNEKHQLIINGRKKNMIVLDNGKNVYPEEIENYIMRIPYIGEVVVKGIKNEIGQEVALCAEVFLNQEKIEELKIENAEESLKKDIARVTKDLPLYKHIAKIEIRETEFNKTTTNKIKR